MQISNTHSYHHLGEDGKSETELSTKILKDRYKICPKCGNFTNYSDTNSYCHLCGTKYVSECTECKEPVIYPLSKFCPACGTRIHREDI
jgi:hypothetical protein